MASELAVWPESAPPEEGRKPSSRPVDLVHLSRYTLGERALEREVLELFCVQSVVYLERLRQGAVRPDQDWKDAAHSLSKDPPPPSAPGGRPTQPSGPKRYPARP
jgi:hypothetical protein